VQQWQMHKQCLERRRWRRLWRYVWWNW